MSLLNFKQQPIIDVPAIGDLTRGMQPVGLSQIKNIKNLVSSRLATEFGAVFTTDSEGNVTITDYGKSADQPQAVNIRHQGLHLAHQHNRWQHPQPLSGWGI